MVCNQSLEIQKDNGMSAMLDDKHGCHTTVFWISRDWLMIRAKLQNTQPTDLHTLNNNSVHCNISRSSKTPTPGPGILQSLLFVKYVYQFICSCSSLTRNAWIDSFSSWTLLATASSETSNNFSSFEKRRWRENQKLQSILLPS